MSVARLRGVHRDEFPIRTPCGAEWSKMTPADGRAIARRGDLRLCAECNKVVHDLSTMGERDAKDLAGSGPVCIRYLYDVHGRVLFGGAPEGARVVPASSLLTKVARQKWLAAAALATVPMVFEACGGGPGDDLPSAIEGGDPTATRGHVPATPAVDDGSDGGDGGDASPSDASRDAGSD